MVQALEAFHSVVIMGLSGGRRSEDDEQNQILGIVKTPYLQRLECEKQNRTYTLVLDLDETLVHYFETENSSTFSIRPGVAQFLEKMSKYFELIIFTAAIQDYADWAIDQIDPYNLIKHRLYRQHAVP